VAARFAAPVQTGTRTDQPFVQCVPGLFSGGKAAWDWPHPPPYRAEAKERVQLHLHTPSGPLWPVIRWIYPFYLYFDCKLLLLLYRKQGPLQIHNSLKQNNVHGFRFRTSTLCVVDCYVLVGLFILYPFIFRPKARVHTNGFTPSPIQERETRYKQHLNLTAVIELQLTTQT
jgi:hypothetical protein